MLLQKYYIFPGIKKLKKYLISQDMVEYIIASTIKLSVVTITRSLRFLKYGTDE